MQRRRCCAKIPMDISIMVHVKTMQRRIFNANISMDISTMMNALTMQRCKRCSFDSPGLTSESEGYPGLFAVSGNNAVGVVLFVYWHVIAAFQTENVQHLRR